MQQSYLMISILTL